MVRPLLFSSSMEKNGNSVANENMEIIHVANFRLFRPISHSWAGLLAI
jgi:hypothetical protein